MNKDAGQSAWSNAQQDFPGGEDDFSAFLELGDFGLDLGNFDMSVDAQNELHESILAGGFGGVNMGVASSMNNMGTNAPMRRSGKMPSNNSLQLPQGPISETELCLMDFNPSAAQLQLGQYSQQHFVTGGYIPPTPSSMELQAGLQSTSGYMNHTPFMEQYQNLQEDQMVFTPLVSPAVTPFDTSFISLPEFANMGAYLSPINSPALEAQHPSRGHSRRISTNTSPVEPKDLSSSLAKKNLRRKSANLRNPARVVRESPNMKPVRRKPPSALITTAELTEPAKEVPTIQTPRRTLGRRMPGLSGSSSREGSSTDSISPEPLSEALMPPPPAPIIGHKPSHVHTNDQMDVDSATRDVTSDARSLAPATPASLMNIAKAKLAEKTKESNHGSSGFLTNDIIAGFAANSKDHKAAVADAVVDETNDQTLPEDEQSTPTLSSTRPTIKAKRSLEKEDATNPQNRPLVPSTTKPVKSSPASLGRKDSKSHSKRGSIHISPAIQPKISPNIKPLLPNSMTSSATAHLLASRSNYENIVSGTHNQLGLSYPAHMSTDLTSKRTSHKLAEQGRRDRMNNAIAEIASLLPANSNKTGGEGDREVAAAAAAAEKENSNSVAAQSSSKASTVEMAIDYIKELQQQIEQMKGKLCTVEAELQVYKDMNHKSEQTET